MLAVVAPFCFGGLNAKANLLTTFPEMGDLLRWAALSLGGGVSATDSIDQFSDNTDIFGDVGIAGDGNLTMSGGATIHGDLYYYSAGTLAGATLTLQGSVTTNFVLNVSSQFSLSGSSKIVLSGGVAWDCVLFNVVNSGSDVTLSGQSTLNGVLMANKRTVSLSGGSTVNGEVIANKIALSGSSVIVHPPLSSP